MQKVKTGKRGLMDDIVVEALVVLYDEGVGFIHAICMKAGTVKLRQDSTNPIFIPSCKNGSPTECETYPIISNVSL